MSIPEFEDNSSSRTVNMMDECREQLDVTVTTAFSTWFT
jgi:hypothetical protein